jgi:hypothetical protein
MIRADAAGADQSEANELCHIGSALAAGLGPVGTGTYGADGTYEIKGIEHSRAIRQVRVPAQKFLLGESPREHRVSALGLQWFSQENGTVLRNVAPAETRGVSRG